MKNFLLTCTFLYNSFAIAQTPPLNWALRFGGSAVDIPYSIKFTTDGGTIAAGYTDSQDGQVSPHANREYWDLWVVKLNVCGAIQWELSLGGTGYESARDIEQTADGGYIVLGETNSTDGGVIAGYGGTKDIWLIKLAATGAVQWQKRYGGNGLDIGNDISITSNGDYLIAASTSSNDGDVAGNHGTAGYTDGLILKINTAGNVIYSKCFGGTKNEELLKIVSIGGRTYAAGYANSIDGDIPPNQKNYDAWLLALDDNGNKIFSKIYGGSQNDVAYSMTAGTNGSLTIAGYTTSNDGDVSGAKGSQDYWVLNVTTAGILNWQKVLGGTEADYCNAILTDFDGGYIAAGISYSADGDIDDARGEGDYWLVKLSATGTIVWKKNFGGSGNDHLRSIIYKPLLEEYYLSGDSETGGEFTSVFGDVDFGIIKLKKPLDEIKDSTVCDLAAFIPISDTLRDACGYDSVYVEYNPVLINGPLHDLKKSDTIFIGQSLTLPASGNGNIAWQGHPTLSCSNCPNPVATPTVTTIYTVENTLPHGCVIEDQFRLVVLNDAVLFTPTAFTPNGDGLNDYFGPLGKVPDGFRLQVFNRYGETVFVSTVINTRWDGRYKGEVQPMGSFVYVVVFKDINQKQHQQKGYFTLIR
ncbi:MAG: gliding motility-associated C-terminal domain-containing protein [Rhizobacter sp.]|nr:gliding motility-associated C-terminal domain-containing protein [Ferruginibacter sp.]